MLQRKVIERRKIVVKLKTKRKIVKFAQLKLYSVLTWEVTHIKL